MMGFILFFGNTDCDLKRTMAWRRKSEDLGKSMPCELIKV